MMQCRALVMAGLLATCGLTFAEDAPDALFFEWGIRGTVRQFLYPETRYDSNPAVLVDLNDAFVRPRVFVSTRGEFDRYIGWYAQTERRDHVGVDPRQIEANLRTSPLELDMGARFFLPLSQGLTVGADLGFDRRSRTMSEKLDAGWDGNPNAESWEWMQSNWRVRGTGYGAYSTGSVDLGLKAGASLFRQDGEAQREEERTNDELTGVFSVEDDVRKVAVDAAAGTRFVLGNSRIGVGVDFGYSAEDSVPWEQDASDPTRIVPITGNNAVDEQLDRTEMLDLTINASLEMPISSQLRIIASGDLPVARRSVTERYARVAGSKELERITERSEFSLSLGAGLSWRPRSNIDVRTGAVFTGDSQPTLAEIYDANGSLSNPNNPSGAPEVPMAPGTPYSDQEIIDAGHVAWRGGNTLGLDASITFSPAGPLTLFAGGTLSRVSYGKSFEVYNPTTELVLMASSAQLVRSVHFIPTLGAALEFRNGSLLSVNSSWARNAISLDWFDQDLRGFPPSGDVRQRDLAVEIDVILRL